MVIALFRPGSGVDTWLALLVTGVVTVVMWALARPFRRLAAMVSLTRDQIGGILPPPAPGRCRAHAARSTSAPGRLVDRTARRERHRRRRVAPRGQHPGAHRAGDLRRRHRHRGAGPVAGGQRARGSHPGSCRRPRGGAGRPARRAARAARRHVHGDVERRARAATGTRPRRHAPRSATPTAASTAAWPPAATTPGARDGRCRPSSSTARRCTGSTAPAGRSGRAPALAPRGPRARSPAPRAPPAREARVPIRTRRGRGRRPTGRSGSGRCTRPRACSRSSRCSWPSSSGSPTSAGAASGPSTPGRALGPALDRRPRCDTRQRPGAGHASCGPAACR